MCAPSFQWRKGRWWGTQRDPTRYRRCSTDGRKMVSRDLVIEEKQLIHLPGNSFQRNGTSVGIDKWCTTNGKCIARKGWLKPFCCSNELLTRPSPLHYEVDDHVLDIIRFDDKGNNRPSVVVQTFSWIESLQRSICQTVNKAEKDCAHGQTM